MKTVDARPLMGLALDFDEPGGWWGSALATLTGLAVGCRAKRMLEIGVGMGASTRALLVAAELNEGQLISIDQRDCMVWVPPHPRWLFLRGWSRDVLPTVNGPFDLALVDGEHTEEAVSFELATIGPRMAPRGIVVCDDCYHPFDGVTQAFENATFDRPVEKSLVQYGLPQSLYGEARTLGVVRFLE